MTYWKPLLSLFIIIFAGGLVYLYFLTVPKTTSSTLPTSTQTTSTVQVQPTPNVPVPQEISNQTSSPAEFTKDFYAWYLQGIMKDASFPNSDQFKSTIHNWLTPDFIANWQTMIENINVSPILLAQDYANSWSTNITASATSQTATTTSVLVSLGTISDLKRLVVELVPVTDGTWRISRISNP